MQDLDRAEPLARYWRETACALMVRLDDMTACLGIAALAILQDACMLVNPVRAHGELKLSGI